MNKLFNPGDFNCKIEFYSRPNERNTTGDIPNGWTFVKRLYAKKEPILGKELYTALTTDSKVEVKFKMRYSRGIDDNMHIKHGTQTYGIISLVDVDNAHREILCYCKLIDGG